jgi:hypothetical protein
LCGAKHDVFTGARIPRKHILVETVNGKMIDDYKVGHVDLSKSSKIFMHFIKGKISLSPMETILVIPRKLKNLESFMKLAKKKHDEGLKLINLTKMERPTIVNRINVHKNHHNKTLHLLMEINNHLVEKLVDTNASMFVIKSS